MMLYVDIVYDANYHFLKWVALVGEQRHVSPRETWQWGGGSTCSIDT